LDPIYYRKEPNRDRVKTKETYSDEEQKLPQLKELEVEGVSS
jgi:hypothetical protein